MSLEVLLRCSDSEFERLVSLMDLEGTLDIISELQTEMDKEQRSFDQLTAEMSCLTDQSSADFKRVSQSLIRSQNRLALLMSRNIHCFNMSDSVEDDVVLRNREAHQTKPGQDNSACDAMVLNHSSNHQDSLSHKKTSKVIKISKVIKRRTVIKPDENHQINSDGVLYNTDFNDSSVVRLNTISKDQVDNGRVSSTATFNVGPPQRNQQQSKPKRTLIVQRRSSNDSIHSHPKCSTSEPSDGMNTPLGDSSNKLTSRPSSIRYSLQAARNKYFSSLSNIQPENELSTENSGPLFHQLRPNKEETNSIMSPRSVSDIQLSPRSDASSILSPRALLSKPLTISSILELDMPETIIDDDSWVEEELGRNTKNCNGGASDKVSCTTDESGFTSASSESDTTLTPPDVVYDYHGEDDEKVEERVFLKHWYPIKLLESLYELKLASENSMDYANIINMEGYLERLPLGTNKNTLLKTWKRTYCKAIHGIIYFHEGSRTDEAQSHMCLMGGVVEEMSNKMIGIDNMRGQYLMVRCASEVDYLNWKRCFYTQIKCSPQSNYIRPCLASNPVTSGTKVVIIDLGSTSVRAGLLGTTPTYPELFFPCVSSSDHEGNTVVGFDAYKPCNRVNGLHHPIASSKDVNTYRVNVHVLPAIFRLVFSELGVDTAEYMVMLSCPHNFSGRLKEEVMNILVGEFNVAGVNMVNQSLLVPYVYSATSGIVVDVGERIEIVAITDGYLVDGGLTRQSYGGTRLTDILNSYLVEYRLFTPVEHLITRYLKEKLCFISQDYGDDLLKYMCNSSACEATTDLNNFSMPESFHIRKISVDTARFKATEGLMKTELLGVDSPTFPKLIEQVIQRCPMDTRREMWQSIYLSGGTTLIDGFSERLQKELRKIAPPSINVQVHTSPHRYHAAYIGACMLAKLPNFRTTCITKEEWRSHGLSAFTKWKSYFQG